MGVLREFFLEERSKLPEASFAGGYFCEMKEFEGKEGVIVWSRDL